MTPETSAEAKSQASELWGKQTPEVTTLIKTMLSKIQNLEHNTPGKKQALSKDEILQIIKGAID